MEHLYWFQPNFIGSAKKGVVTCISVCNRKFIDTISGVTRSVTLTVKIDCQNGSQGSN